MRKIRLGAIYIHGALGILPLKLGGILGDRLPKCCHGGGGPVRGYSIVEPVVLEVGMNDKELILFYILFIMNEPHSQHCQGNYYIA